MAQHKWHKEIKAWADGAEIEYRNNGFENWNLVESKSPEWLFDNYRIKPPQHCCCDKQTCSAIKKPQYLYVAYLDEEETWDFSLNKDLIECSPIHRYIGKIKLEDNDNGND